jgi:5-(carboxyamino)imidazole ribonucleotide mutase
MPKGVPVATVAVNAAFNAGLLAIQILALNNNSLTEKLELYKLNQQEQVSKMNQDLLTQISETRNPE